MLRIISELADGRLHEQGYSVDTLPKILDDYRWPELFWAEDIIGETAQPLGPDCPPRRPNNYERMTVLLDCIINDKAPLVGEDGARRGSDAQS
jgi:hypothetical protein